MLNEPQPSLPAFPENTSDEQSPLLSSEQQDILIEFLFRGASPAAACGQLGVSYFAFLRTWYEDEAFRARVDGVSTALSQNITTALYQAAMKGNVTAQKFWLEKRPPPGWSTTKGEPMQPMTFDEIFSKLSDEELRQLADAMGVDLPNEDQGDVPSAEGPDRAGDLPS